VTAAGARSYVFNYRVRGSGQQRRITIGSVADWSASTARIEAKRLRRVVDGGGDPRGDHEQSRDAPTMSELLDRFEAEYLPRSGRIRSGPTAQSSASTSDRISASSLRLLMSNSPTSTSCIAQ